jgi:membrane protease YdiL (CAAX protease family)
MSTVPPAPHPARVHPAPPLVPELPDGVEPTPAGPGWKAWMAVAALVAGFAAAAIFLGLFAGIFGSSLSDPPPSVNILATVLQGACLILAAYLFARSTGHAKPWDFGLRPTRFLPAVGWSALTWFSFLLVTVGWTALIGAQDARDQLPEELGVDESNVALVSAAILVCVIAPIAEEFFFRGFFFKALSSWKGIWPAAIATGIVFGAVHGGSSNPAFLLPLGFFGFALCLLYVKTGSLYPCIVIHSLNNSLAFGVALDWGWQILPVALASLAVIAGVLALVRVAGGRPPALPAT